MSWKHGHLISLDHELSCHSHTRIKDLLDKESKETCSGSWTSHFLLLISFRRKSSSFFDVASILSLSWQTLPQRHVWSSMHSRKEVDSKEIEFQCICATFTWHTRSMSPLVSCYHQSSQVIVSWRCQSMRAEYQRLSFLWQLKECELQTFTSTDSLAKNLATTTSLRELRRQVMGK